MAARARARTAQQLELLRWAGALGAVTAEALAARDSAMSPASARGRLAAAQRAGLVRAWRLLDGEPPIYTVTRAGLRAAGRTELPACRLNPGSAAHAAACCSAAVALEALYTGHRVLGEPEIRSGFAELCPRIPTRGVDRRHRPDLLLLGPGRNEPPIAVEVELTVKAPERLAAICLAGARHPEIGGGGCPAAPPPFAPPA